MQTDERPLLLLLLLLLLLAMRSSSQSAFEQTTVQKDPDASTPNPTKQPIIKPFNETDKRLQPYRSEGPAVSSVTTPWVPTRSCFFHSTLAFSSRPWVFLSLLKFIFFQWFQSNWDKLINYL